MTTVLKRDWGEGGVEDTDKKKKHQSKKELQHIHTVFLMAQNKQE